MRIVEIYRSIQGESTYSGLPCTFIRTAGCSLRCSYCDTAYALHPSAGNEMPLETILEQTAKWGFDLVEITGGEPLEQDDIYPLCERLLQKKTTILLETSGAYSIEPLPHEVIKIVDFKTPSSRMADRNNWKNVPLLSERDEIKFVIGTREDFEWSLEACKTHNLLGRNPVLFSPSFMQLSLQDLAQWILEEKAPVRLQMQMHKYIWSPTARGV